MRAALTAEFLRSKCVGPEETIKNGVAAQVDALLAAAPVGQPYIVEASGSQSTPDSSKPTEVVNQLQVKVQPLWNFVE